MSGVALVAAAFVVFVAACAAMVFATISTLRQAGMALNPRRPADQRRLRAALAVLSGVAVIGSATLGYVGIAALMYYAQQP
jgi:hypothetical protein